MELKDWFIVILGTLYFMNCASSSFHYFGVDQVSYDHGMLLGPTPKDDLPFTRCAPDAESRHKCIVMFSKDFFAMKQDYEDVKMRLKECEKR